MAGTAFGFGSPLMSASTPLTWGLAQSGPGISPIGIPSLSGQSGYTMQPQHQIHQLLQSLPQQLQQIQQLQYVQQQQLQQLIQYVPAQLIQLQQLIQIVAQQLQQTQQPLGQVAVAGGFGVTPWGITPQPFATNPAQVM